MIKKLSTRLILIFTAVLTGLFVVLTLVIELVVPMFIRTHIRDTIYSYQDDVDESVTAVVDRVAYSYSRMVRASNAGVLNRLSAATVAARSEALKELAETAATGGIFADVGWRDENGYLSVNGYTLNSESAAIDASQHLNSVRLGEYKNGCVVFAVYMKQDFTDSEGVFYFFMDETALSSCFSGFDTEMGYSYIIRTDGYVVSHEDKDYVGKLLYYRNLYDLDNDRNYSVQKLDGEEKIIIASNMRTFNERYGFDCYLVSVMDYDYYYGDFQTLGIVFIVIAASVFTLGILIAVLRAKRLSKPIAELDGNIETIRQTGKKGRRTAREGDELYALEQKYDEMMDELFTLMESEKENAETQRKLELETLQMQINPHFLYNTLDAVVWMAKIEKNTKIESLVVNLAKFFRLSLHKGDKFITVGEEIELMRHYLEIDRIRFPDKVKPSFEIEEGIEGYQVLKLILQPVVENALKYAFGEGAGTLAIRARSEGGDFVFEVEDDGVGFDVPADILEKKTGEHLGGFGLYNVNERIRLEYGEKYGITVVSEKGKGTKVTLRVAKRI